MRYSRIARLIIRFFLLILASTMSIVSFLGGYSAVLILSDEDNIDLDHDMRGNFFDVNDTTFKFEVDFKFKNVGYFDLEDLEIELELYARYYHWNLTIPGVSDRKEVLVYETEEDLGTVENGQTLRDAIKIERGDIEANVTDILINLDISKDPWLEFIARDIVIKGKYSLNLIEFKVEIEKYKVGEIP